MGLYSAYVSMRRQPHSASALGLVEGAPLAGAGSAHGGAARRGWGPGPAFEMRQRRATI
jgi:hypothetical protein